MATLLPHILIPAIGQSYREILLEDDVGSYVLHDVISDVLLKCILMNMYVNFSGLE